MLSGPQKATVALTTLHSFMGGYFARFGDADGLRAVIENDLWTPLDAACVGKCTTKAGSTIDPWDVDSDIGQARAALIHYPSSSGQLYTPEFWQLYRPLALGLNKATAHDRLQTFTMAAPYNKHGGVRHYRYIGTGQPTTIALTDLKGGACTDDLTNMRVRRAGQQVAADASNKGATAGCPKVTFLGESGVDYTVEVSVPNKEPATPIAGWDLAATVQ